MGDFDGDGTQDLFLATGAAWYYSPAGKAEWRFLNAQTDAIGSLLFGDFDADGRTDVFTQHVYSWDVSWGGASRWENINVSWAILGNVAVGDFIGDERDDIFYADGQQWWVSRRRRRSSSRPSPRSQVSRPQLALRRFQRERENGRLQRGGWSLEGVVQRDLRLGPAAGEADRFGGQPGGGRFRRRRARRCGHLEVGLSPATFGACPDNGAGGWTTLREASPSLSSAPAIGRFDDNASADVLLWRDNYMEILGGGVGPSRRHSRQDLR